MDAQGFDVLVWSLARRGPRRAALAAIAGGAASVLAAATTAGAGALANGRRCGGSNRPRCRRCASGCAHVGPNGGRRCAAVLDGSCATAADCCNDTFQSTCAGGQCAAILSDRTAKTAVVPIDGRAVLSRLKELPIATWRYADEAAGGRRLGPMAQDFAAAFGLGGDDRLIGVVDGQGVALAAVQGLARIADDLRADNAALAARLALLERGGCRAG